MLSGKISETLTDSPDGAGDGYLPTGYLSLEKDGWRDLPAGQVIQESEVCIFVNGQELATMAATPLQQEALALGFLANEGLIGSIAEVRSVGLHGQGLCIDVWLDHAIPRPERRVLTSGCTGGVTFDHLAHKLAPVSADLRLTPAVLGSAMRQLYQAGRLYRLTRGVHTSGLWQDGRLILAAEDIGRHNTVDKLYGLCLQQGIDPRGSLLVSTGRISSEMLTKAARMGCPVVASRTSATSLSVQLARQWGVTLVGYLRGQEAGRRGWRMVVYSRAERIMIDDIRQEQSGS
jgi:FdhD protein